MTREIDAGSSALRAGAAEVGRTTQRPVAGCTRHALDFLNPACPDPTSRDKPAAQGNRETPVGWLTAQAASKPLPHKRLVGLISLRQSCGATLREALRPPRIGLATPLAPKHPAGGRLAGVSLPDLRHVRGHVRTRRSAPERRMPSNDQSASWGSYSASDRGQALPPQHCRVSSPAPGPLPTPPSRSAPSGFSPSSRRARAGSHPPYGRGSKRWYFICNPVTARSGLRVATCS